MQIISPKVRFFLFPAIHFFQSAAQWPWISRPQRHCVLLEYPANKAAEAKESIRNSTNKQTYGTINHWFPLIRPYFLGGPRALPPEVPMNFRSPKQDSTKLNDVDLMVLQHLNCFPFLPTLRCICCSLFSEPTASQGFPRLQPAPLGASFVVLLVGPHVRPVKLPRSHPSSSRSPGCCSKTNKKSQWPDARFVWYIIPTFG